MRDNTKIYDDDGTWEAWKKESERKLIKSLKELNKMIRKSNRKSWWSRFWHGRVRLVEKPKEPYRVITERYNRNGTTKISIDSALNHNWDEGKPFYRR